MSVVDYQRPECTDISGNGYDLQSANALGDVLFGQDPTPGIAPVAVFSGAANSYLTRADGGAGNWADILGTEAYIIAAQRGLSLGGWFWWAALPGAGQWIIAKDDVGANRQYALLLNAGNAIQLSVWPGPVSVVSAATIVSGWNHIAGLYDQATRDLHVILNGVVTTNAGTAPAALADTGAALTIGADGAGANRFTGRASDCFLCAAFLSTNFVRALFHHTKAVCGVK
jgi:hypothetical protein